MKPRLWGQPNLDKTPADLRLLRQTMPKLQEEDWQDLVKIHEASIIQVFDPKRNSRYFLDLKEAAATLACPQWFNTLQQPMMTVVWTRAWPDATKFQYIINITSAGSLPAEVGFRDSHPMWSYPPTAVNSSTDNITFGMDVTHFCENPTTDQDGLVAQCPIVCFKAPTVLQSLGIIVSRILLPSSDVQGGSQEGIYCPTTWLYAHSYDTPAQYSDALFEKGALPILARECVLSVIVQMSNRDQRHAQCANAHAPSSVVSGRMISLTPFYQPKKP